ncbi:MAG: 4Fe-4S binding protein [Victivallales bacterium]|nr:4Fe-4S binding protein [Victivallales bacterium]
MTPFAEFRKNVGYDLVGVPPMSCFDGLPPNEHPLSIFPDGKSVLVVGAKIRRGRFRSMEEGSLWSTQPRWLTGFEGLVRCIEREGHECVPYAPVDAPRMPRRPLRDGQCAPNGVRLSIDFAAVAAGLGEIGYHGMFMTERFGIRQSIGLIVTDMAIEPGSSEEKASDICDGCMACVQACPLQAISADNAGTLTCNGRSMTLGAVNAAACRACPNGAAGDSKYFAGAEELHFDIENNQVKGDASVFGRGGLPNRLTAACGRACIAHFEATHDTGYKIPFRTREPWGFRPDEAREW